MDEKKIPIIILTGFLGSGKTTLLKECLNANQGRLKIAIIMNEIGDISIDAKILSGYKLDIYELNDGCICCSVNENFVETLDELATSLSPDMIIVETTGVANPMSLLYSIHSPRYTVDTVITVVDALNFMTVYPSVDVAVDQIEAADVLLLTKLDGGSGLPSAKSLHALEHTLRTLQPKARLLPKSSIPVATLFGLDGSPRHSRHTDADLPSLHDNTSRHSHDDEASSHVHDSHVDAEGIERFSLAVTAPFDLGQLQGCIESFPAEVWRFKGIVSISLGDHIEPSIINMAFGRYTIEPFNDAIPEQEGHVVFIGRGILAMKDHLISALNTAEASEVSRNPKAS